MRIHPGNSSRENLPALDLTFHDGRIEGAAVSFSVRATIPRRWTDAEQTPLDGSTARSMKRRAFAELRACRLEALYNLHEGDKEKTALSESAV
jgi:exodeoxyribonuclease I